MDMTKRRCFKILAAVLCIVLLACCFPSVFLTKADATAADNYETTLLSTLSSSFEGTVGTISSGAGDYGGKSYGLLQFASAQDSPKSYFTWCLNSSDADYRYVGRQLSDAYAADGNTYGASFDSTWTALAGAPKYGGNGGIFAASQLAYGKTAYYTPVVESVAAACPGFDVSNYSIALRSVIWSRATQHGVSGAVTVITRAFASLGGFKNQPEAELIAAIYAESGAVGEPQTNVMSGSNALKYGISGSTMKYFSACSADVQWGVYLRLNVNEPAKAFARLASYGEADAPLASGLYKIASSSALRLVYYGSGYYTITGTTGDQTDLRLTDNNGTVAFAPATAGNNQFWKLVGSGSSFALQNRATGKYLLLSGGSFASSGAANAYSFTTAGSDWSLNGGAYPCEDNYLVEGYGFWIRGTLHSSNTIQQVNISLINASGTAVISRSATVNANNYDLSALDNSISFGSLSVGAYTFRITATDAASSTYTLEKSFHVVPEGDSAATVLTFCAQGGACDTVYRTLTSGSAYGALPTAAKSGYTFLGWFTSPVGGTQVSAQTVASGSNRHVYAQYDVGSAVEDFARTLYTGALLRECENEGNITYLVSTLESGERTAADVACSFFDSYEYCTVKPHSDTEFVTSLYVTLYGRTPTESEVSALVSKITSGTTTRVGAFCSFIASSEFTARCAALGIVPGTIDPAEHTMGQIVVIEDATTFARALYTGALLRECENEGNITYLASALTSGQRTAADVACSFFDSYEYCTVKPHSDTEFVTSLFVTLYGRTPTESEVSTWVDAIAGETTTRVGAFCSFIASSEFTARCAKLGITPGAIDPASHTMGQIIVVKDATTFARTLYTAALLRECENEGNITYLASALTSGQRTAADVACSFFDSYEYCTVKPHSDTEFVTSLYVTLYGRTPTASEVSALVNQITSGTTTRVDAFCSFIASSEFTAYCAKMGITPGAINPAGHTMGQAVPDAAAYARTLYTGALLRECENEGNITYLASALTSGERTAADVACSFFDSYEYCTVKPHSNTEFVTSLYVTLCGRTPTSDEVTALVNQITSGATTRVGAFCTMIASSEFTARCAKMGITPGTIDPAGHTMGG